MSRVRIRKKLSRRIFRKKSGVHRKNLIFGRKGGIRL